MGHTVFEAVAEGVGAGRQLLVDYHAAAHAGDLARMHDLQEALEAANGWTLEHRIEATLSRLALPDGTPLQHGLMTACFAEASV